MPTTLNYTATYDPTTDIGKVRMAIQDVDVDSEPPAPTATTPRDQWSCLFVDQEIQIAIDRYADKANATDLAAADLLEDMASSSAILARLITLGDYTSDTHHREDAQGPGRMAPGALRALAGGGLGRTGGGD